MALENMNCQSKEERAEVIERLARRWEDAPDLRLGELLTRAFQQLVQKSGEDPRKSTLFFIGDSTLVHAVEDFVGWMKITESDHDEGLRAIENALMAATVPIEDASDALVEHRKRMTATPHAAEVFGIGSMISEQRRAQSAPLPPLDTPAPVDREAVTQPEHKSLGQLQYEAVHAAMQGQSVYPPKPWDELSLKTRRAYDDAANALLDESFSLIAKGENVATTKAKALIAASRSKKQPVSAESDVEVSGELAVLCKDWKQRDGDTEFFGDDWCVRLVRTEAP